jgi:hypothetical protein
MVELYEEDIEDWYYHHRKEHPLIKYLCQHIVLKKEDRSIISFYYFEIMILKFDLFIDLSVF